MIMKKLLFIALIIIELSSCCTKKEEPKVHNFFSQNRLLMLTDVALVDTIQSDWISQVNVLKYMEILLKKVITETKTFYKPYIDFYQLGTYRTLESLDEEELCKRMGVDQPKNLMAASNFEKLKEIQSIRFTENWSFDPEKLIFNKDVIDLMPVKHYAEGTGKDIRYARKMLFAFHQHPDSVVDNSSTQGDKIIGTVKYEFPIEQGIVNDGNYETFCPYWNKHVAEKLLAHLFLGIEKGKFSALYPSFSAEDGKAITWNEIEKRMGVGIDTVMVDDQKVAIEKQLDISEIKLIIFCEEWSYNSKNLKFYKKVKYIEPVRVFIRDEEVIKKIVFRLNLN